MKRVFALAGLTLLAAPALADTSVIASVMDSRIEAGTLDASPLALTVELRHELSEYFIGALVSGISAYLCIHYFLAFINRIGMQPFVIYRVVLGVVILVI